MRIETEHLALALLKGCMLYMRPIVVYNSYNTTADKEDCGLWMWIEVEIRTGISPLPVANGGIAT